MNLNEFAREVHALAVEKGFYDPEPSDAELIAAIHSEISEAFEEWRDWKPNVWYECDECICNSHMDEWCAGRDDETGQLCSQRDPEPHGIAVELIDVVLRILDAAAAKGGEISTNAYYYTSDHISQMDVPNLAVYLHYETSVLHTRTWYNGDMYGVDGREHLSRIVTAILTWLRTQNIDPEALLREKHEYNKARPYRHGGKRV